MGSTLKPKILIQLGLNKTGLTKGLSGAIQNLNGLNKIVSKTSKNSDKAASGFGRLGKAIHSAFFKLAGAFLLYNITRKIVGVLEKGVGAAMDFDTAMRNVDSVAKMDKQTFQDLTDQVVDLALDPRIKDGPAKLADGLYFITSAGYSTADALVILKQAAFAATAGLSTTSTAAELLIGVLGAYGATAKDAEHYTDALFQIVNISKYSFDALANAMPAVISNAAKAGIPIEALGAAMATMGFQGVSARTAAVNLNAVIKGLLDPSDELAAAMANAGIESGEWLLKNKGLGGTMEWLNGLIGDSATLAAKYFHDQRANRGVLFLTGAGVKYYADNLKLMNDEEGATQDAVKRQMAAVSFQVAVLKKNLQILAVLGFGLLAPYIVRATTFLNVFFFHLLKTFRGLRKHGHTFADSLRMSVEKTLNRTFGKKTVAEIMKWYDAIKNAFVKIKHLAQKVFPYLVMVFKFLGKHIDSVITIVILLAVTLQVLGPIVEALIIAFQILNAVWIATAFIAGVLSISMWVMVPILLILVAAVVLFAIAYHKNWLGIRDITNSVIRTIIVLWKAFYGAFKKTDAFHRLTRILNRLFHGLVDIVQEFQRKGFIATIHKIGAEIHQLGKDFGKLAEDLTKSRLIGQFVRHIFDDVANIIKGTAKLIKDIVNGDWKAAFGDLLYIVKNALLLLFDFFFVYFGALPIILYNFFAGLPWGSIGHALWSGLKSAFMFMWDNGIVFLYKLGARSLWWMYNGMKDSWKAHIVPWVADRVAHMVAVLLAGQDLLKQVGNDLMKGFSDGVAYGWNWFYGWYSKLSAWLGYAWGNPQLVLMQIGNDIIKGLADGIIYGWNWMMQWLPGLFSSLPLIAKKVLRIFSPSQIFADIGEAIPKGLACGIDKAMPDVVKAMKGMTDTTLTAPNLNRQSAGTNGGIGLESGYASAITSDRSRSGGPITINVYGAVGQDEGVLAEKVARRMNREFDLHQAAQR